MELMALDTARDFSNYLGQDWVKATLETLPDEVRKYLLNFAAENERNLDELRGIIEDAVSEIEEAAHRMENAAEEMESAVGTASSAAEEAGYAASSASSVLDGLGRL
jgi:methyl-accepting chemotaxis protein